MPSMLFDFNIQVFQFVSNMRLCTLTKLKLSTLMQTLIHIQVFLIKMLLNISVKYEVTYTWYVQYLKQVLPLH